MKTKHPQPSPTPARLIRHSSFVIRHSSAAFTLLFLSASLPAQEPAPAPSSPTLTPEQQKALSSGRVGEAPKMPSWMRGADPAPKAPALDPNQVELIKAEMARQKEQSEQFSKTHERLHGGKTTEARKGDSPAKDPSGKTSHAGDFVENYLTVTGILERDGQNGETSEDAKAKEEAEKTSRGIEARLTGISEALLGGAADPLSSLADRLGGIAVAPSAPVISGPALAAGRNPYLGAASTGSYAMGANGALVTREQSANPYLAAGNAAAGRPAPVYTAPTVSTLPPPAAFAPPPPPPPPAPTPLERDREQEARQKRFFPNKDRF